MSVLFCFSSYFSVLESRHGTEYAVNFIETCLEHEQLHGEFGKSMPVVLVVKFIRITCLLTPHFYLVKLGFTGVYIFF